MGKGQESGKRGSRMGGRETVSESGKRNRGGPTLPKPSRSKPTQHPLHSPTQPVFRRPTQPVVFPQPNPTPYPSVDVADKGDLGLDVLVLFALLVHQAKVQAEPLSNVGRPEARALKDLHVSASGLPALPRFPNPCPGSLFPAPVPPSPAPVPPSPAPVP